VTGQRTYWHLLPAQRKPTEYEIVTSNLLYYVNRGFETRVPAEDWYRRYQKGSPLNGGDWERFRDPRETTYTRYTEQQKRKEIFVDGLLSAMEATGYDGSLPPAWVRVLSRVMAPLRYPVHGLQMIAAYAGSMAPGGRITIACLLQAADEMRRVQRLAYRLRQLQESHPGFGADSRALWQDDPLWQPLREAVERLLVTYDWGESFVALNLVLKPMLDELLMVQFGRLAQRAGDDLLAQVLFSLNEDCRWHRDWSAALVLVAIKDRPENRDVIQAWVDGWRPAAEGALAAYAPVFEDMPDPPARTSFTEVLAQVQDSCARFWATCGLA
jgi:toluene monooxygenase system protein E